MTTIKTLEEILYNKFKDVFEKHNFYWVDDIEDGAYLFTDRDESIMLMPLLRDLYDTFESTLSELTESMIPERRDPKDIVDGETVCQYCGADSGKHEWCSCLDFNTAISEMKARRTKLLK